MHKTYVTAALFASLCMGTALRTANAQHDVRVFLSEDGIREVEKQAPSYVPAVLFPPTLTKSIGCMDFEQRDSVVNFSVEALDIVLVSETRISMEIVFSLGISGQLLVNGCVSASCQDTINVESGHAILDFDLSVVGGEAQVTTRNVDLDIRPNEFAFGLDECGLTGTAVTNAVEFGEGWILEFVLEKVEEFAQDSIDPLLEDLLAGLSMHSSFVDASVQDMYFPNNGISLTADVSFPIPFENDSCTAEFDVPAPGRAQGASVPNLQGPDAAELNVAVNLGLINNAFYSFWRTGLLCLNEQRIAALGVDLDLSIAGALLPGFPAGTTFGLDLKLSDYPKISAENAEGARVTVSIAGLQIDLHGDRPDGSRNTLQVEVSVDATALIVVDPATNTLFAQLEAAEITKLAIADEREAANEGFDVAGIQHLVHDGLLPAILEELGPIPVTGSVFAALDYSVILRSVQTNKAYLSAGIDVFRAPKDDTAAPDTQIVFPEGISNPHTAAIRMRGFDAEIPSELLRFEIRVDGESLPMSIMSEIKIGEFGKTRTYDVEIAAVDLAGNVDPTPSTGQLLVDGIIPTVTLAGARVLNADEGATTFRWSLGDDVTEVQEIAVLAKVYKVENPSDALSARLLETAELAPGATQFEVDLSGKGGLYRVEIVATDKAGNEGVSSFLLTSACPGGCSVGNSRSGLGTAFFLLGLALVAAGRRRKRALR